MGMAVVTKSSQIAVFPSFARIFVFLSSLVVDIPLWLRRTLLRRPGQNVVWSEEDLQAKLNLTRCGLCLVHRSCTVGRGAILIKDEVIVERRSKVTLVQDVEYLRPELHTSRFQSGNPGILDQGEVQGRQARSDHLVATRISQSYDLLLWAAR